MAQTSPSPLALEPERAEGIYIISKDGKKYIDLISGIGVSNLGHSHPKIIDAIQKQSREYMHLMVYGEYIQTPQVALAKGLTEFLPASLNSVYFTNSGAEATEAAMKLAKRATNRSQFIHFKNAYHGSTQGALSVIGDEKFKTNFRPLLPDMLMLEYGNLDDLEKINDQTAAVIIDPIQAESGITIPTIDYLQKLEKKCKENGALFILDEAQTAFGRTGKLFALEYFSITPDILLLAKALGGGMPLGALVASKSLTDLFSDNPILGHITTFGGHPVSCAAGLASLQILTQTSIVKDVESKGQLFEKRLQHQQIKSIRRKGLMMALELENFETNKRVIDESLKNGVITDWFLFADNCLRIAPPLIITNEEIESACDIILHALDKL